MRTIIFLIISSFLLAQPISDSAVKENIDEIPANVKPTIEKIVINSEEAKKASSELDKELKKQISLVKEIKTKIRQLKNTPKAKILISKDENKKIDTVTNTKAVKPNDIYIEVDGQIVQWESKERTTFGKLIHTGNFVYYPYIVDKNGNKIYLNIK